MGTPSCGPTVKTSESTKLDKLQKRHTVSLMNCIIKTVTKWLRDTWRKIDRRLYTRGCRDFQHVKLKLCDALCSTLEEIRIISSISIMDSAKAWNNTTSVHSLTGSIYLLLQLYILLPFYAKTSLAWMIDGTLQSLLKVSTGIYVQQII